MSKIVAIADIHGEAQKLIDVEKQLIDGGFGPSDAQWVFLGDYVDGGPNSRKVVSHLINLCDMYPNIVCLLGNHEDMMLDALRWESRVYGNFYQWYNQGGSATHKAYVEDRFQLPPHTQWDDIPPKDAVDEDHLNWMESLPLFYESNYHIFVHAGLAPNATVHDTTRKEKLWIRNEFILSDYDWGKRVIFGHTPNTKGPRVMPNKIGIDTMYHGHGSITAVVVDDENPTVEPIFFQSYT